MPDASPLLFACANKMQGLSMTIKPVSLRNLGEVCGHYPQRYHIKHIMVKTIFDRQCPPQMKAI